MICPKCKSEFDFEVIGKRKYCPSCNLQIRN